MDKGKALGVFKKQPIRRFFDEAEYGKQVVESPFARLVERYGKGFSKQSLQNFRRFYLVYSERITISSPLGRESDSTAISFPVGGK